MSQATSYSYEVPLVNASTEGKPRRSIHSKEELVSAARLQTKTVFDNFKAGVQKKMDGNCLGRRIMSSDNKATYLWESYAKVYDRVISFGSGLQTYGITKGSIVGVCCRTCPEWVIAEQACYGYGLIVVPMFDNLRPSAFEHIINETEMSMLITTSNKLDLLLMDRNKFPSLRIIVLIDDVKDADKERGHSLDIMLFGFNEVEETGKLGLVEAVPSGLEEVISIIYKEDFNGVPLGVELTNLNMLSAMAGLDILGNNGALVKLSKDDVFLGFMPFADIAQLLWLNFALGEGSEIGFYRGDFATLTTDIEALRPTILCTAPGVLSSLHGDIASKIDESGHLTTAFFNMAVKGKKKNLRHGKMDHYFFDKLVFKKIRSSFGGRIRALISTMTPSSADVIEFFRVALGCEVYEGYAMAETCGFATMTSLGDYECGHIGAPIPSNEIKLVNAEDFGYLATDKPFQRGEMWVRGPNIFKGYFKNPGATRQALDQDEWFHTHTLGTIDLKGRFKFYDSMDSVIKLKSERLVSPEKVEAVLGKSKWVEWCFVCADNNREFLVAIVIPWKNMTADWAKDHKIPGANIKEWVRHPKLKEVILKDLTKVGSKHGLTLDERVRNIFLDDTTFSVENELLTSEFRLIRPNIKKYFQTQLDDIAEVARHAPSPSRRSSLLQSPQSPLQTQPITEAAATTTTATTTATTTTTTTTTAATPASTPAEAKSETVQEETIVTSEPLTPKTPATPAATPSETPQPPIALQYIQGEAQMPQEPTKDQQPVPPETPSEYTNVPLDQEQGKLTVSTQEEQQNQQVPQAQSSLSPVSG